MEIRNIFATAVTVALGLGNLAMATEADFSYSDAASARIYAGDRREQTYNVAIHIIQPEFIGKKVTRISVPVVKGISEQGLTGWLSSELRLKTEDGRKVNDPDMATVEAVISTGDSENILTAVFAEPVEIPEGGLYAGYTFTVDKLDDVTMLPVVGTEGIDPEALYMYCPGISVNWNSSSKARKMVSALQVTMEGEFSGSSLAVIAGNKDKFTAEASFDFPVELTNWSPDRVKSITYTYASSDQSGVNTLEFDPPLAMDLGHSAKASLPIDLRLPLGEHPLNIEVTEVNGSPNINLDKRIELGVTMYSMIPVNRPLVEEYTGTWCMWCPRGIAATEMMTERYGDLFVSAVYHSDDAMAPFTNEQFPFMIQGYPSCMVNRQMPPIDPFYADVSGEKYNFAMPAYWSAIQDQFTPWHIEATAKWNGTEIQVDSRVMNVMGHEGQAGDYTMMYQIVANGLHGEGEFWTQTNNYSGDTGWEAFPEMMRFVNAPRHVEGLRFNNVIIGRSSTWGDDESQLPAVFEASVMYDQQFVFDASSVISVKGDELVQDHDRIYAIACIIDNTTGQVVNSIKCHVDGWESVTGVDGAATVVEERFYNLSGVEVTPSVKGVVVKRTRYSDGSVKAVKVVR